MPSNVSLPFDLFSPFGHNLTDTYLANPSSREQIAKMIMLESLWLVDSMSFTTDDLKHFNLAMASPMFHSANDLVLQNQGAIICSGFGCIDDVLYFTTTWSNNMKETILFFSQQRFAKNSYQIFLGQYSFPIFLLVANPISTIRNTVTCHYSIIIESMDCFNSIDTTLNNSITGEISPEGRNFWSFAIVNKNVSMFFNDGRLLSNEFTIR